MSDDQFWRIILMGPLTIVALLVLSTIKQAVNGWVQREGGVGRALGKRVGRLIKRVRNTASQ